MERCFENETNRRAPSILAPCQVGLWLLIAYCSRWDNCNGVLWVTHPMLAWTTYVFVVLFILVVRCDCQSLRTQPSTMLLRGSFGIGVQVWPLPCPSFCRAWDAPVPCTNSSSFL